MEYQSKEAKFSGCGKYRYWLKRIWDADKSFAMCIALNPSTANGDKDDPTITRLSNLLNAHGFGGFYMTNLFALISSNPEDLVHALTL